MQSDSEYSNRNIKESKAKNPKDNNDDPKYSQ